MRSSATHLFSWRANCSLGTRKTLERGRAGHGRSGGPWFRSPPCPAPHPLPYAGTDSGSKSPPGPRPLWARPPADLPFPLPVAHQPAPSLLTWAPGLPCCPGGPGSPWGPYRKGSKGTEGGSAGQLGHSLLSRLTRAREGAQTGHGRWPWGRERSLGTCDTFNIDPGARGSHSFLEHTPDTARRKRPGNTLFGRRFPDHHATQSPSVPRMDVGWRPAPWWRSQRVLIPAGRGEAR